MLYVVAQFRYVMYDDGDDWTEEFSLLPTYKEEGMQQQQKMKKWRK